MGQASVQAGPPECRRVCHHPAGFGRCASFGVLLVKRAPQRSLLIPAHLTWRPMHISSSFLWPNTAAALQQDDCLYPVRERPGRALPMSHSKRILDSAFRLSNGVQGLVESITGSRAVPAGPAGCQAAAAHNGHQQPCAIHYQPSALAGLSSATCDSEWWLSHLTA
jgi:hypothetical protein